MRAHVCVHMPYLGVYKFNMRVAHVACGWEPSRRIFRKKQEKKIAGVIYVSSGPFKSIN